MENMRRPRRKFSASFKAKVAIEALKERESLAELAHRFELHANQISQWKQEFLKNSSTVFESCTPKEGQEDLFEKEHLYSKIGKLEMEKEYLKKSLKKLGKL